jgi:hypothetical protein
MLKKKRNKITKKKRDTKIKGKKKGISQNKEQEVNEIKHLTNNIFELKNKVSYSIDGEGKIKINSGSLNFNGYIFNKPNIILNFNYSDNYPIFKYENNNKDCKIEFISGKYNLYYENKSLHRLEYIPHNLRDLDYNNYKFYFINGKKSVGKSIFIPYIINRILSTNKKVFYLEFDTEHSYIPNNFCFSLIEILNPILSNVPKLSENLYKIIKSIYIRDNNDIQFIMNKIEELFNNKEIQIKDCCIVINCFSNWNNNANIINSLIYLNHIKNRENSCVIYFKNNFLNVDNANKEKNISEFENIIFEDKNYNINNFPKSIYNNENNNNKKKCSLIITENNFEYQSDNINCDLTINDKKNKEKYNLLISNFSNNNMNLLNIDFSDIIFLLDNNFSLLNNENSIQSILNKYIVILKISNNNNIKVNSLNEIGNYEFGGFGRVFSVNLNEKIIQIYTKIVKEYNEKWIILLEHRINKILRTNKKDMFLKYISNTSFNYNIIKGENIEKKLKNFLGRKSYIFNSKN